MAGVTIISSRLKKKNFQIYSRKTKSTMNEKRRRWMLQLPKKSLNQPATLKVLLKTPKSIFHHGLVWFMWSVPQEGGHWGLLESAKPLKKSSNTEKPKKDSIKTENRMQNCQNRYIFTSKLLKLWSIRYGGDKWSIQSKQH